MSESLTIDPPARQTPVQRHKRLERPAVIDDVDSSAGNTAVIEEGGEHTAEPDSLDQALLDSQKAAKVTQDLANERAARQRTEQENLRLRGQVAQGQTVQRTERLTTLAAHIDAAKSEQESAEAAIIAARDSGDVQAEIKASKRLTSATYNFDRATGELNYLKAQPAPQQNGGQPRTDGGGNGGGGDGGYSPAAQAWIAGRPQFNANPAYKGAALEAHEIAVRDGCKIDSPAYFRALDQHLAEQFGADHINPGSGGDPSTVDTRHNAPRQNGGQQQQRAAQPATSSGGPSNRGGGGASGGMKTVQSDLGPFSYKRSGDGTVTIAFPGGSQTRANFEHGAEVCGMSVNEYMADQVAIAEDKAAGRSTGLTDVRDGVVYR